MMDVLAHVVVFVWRDPRHHGIFRDGSDLTASPCAQEAGRSSLQSLPRSFPAQHFDCLASSAIINLYTFLLLLNSLPYLNTITIHLLFLLCPILQSCVESP